MTNLNQCSGCGAVLQSSNQHEAGYIPAGNPNGMCQRCFRLRHYGEFKSPSSNDDFLSNLQELHQKKSLVVLIVDLHDFHGSWIMGIQRFVGENPILLVLNKIDLLPRTVNRNKIIDWTRRQLKQFNCKPVGVQIVSSKTGEGIQEIIHQVDFYRRGRDVYVVGTTNVGKSSFLNRILESVSENKNILTTSVYPGTTLEMIRIPLDDGKFLIDTPGVKQQHQLTSLVPIEDVEKIIPNKELKPKVFQLQSGQTLFVGGLIRIDYHMGEQNSFTCWVNHDLSIHRTKTENASAFFDKHVGTTLVPPSNRDNFPAFTRIDFPKQKKAFDLAIGGLGWIHVAREATITGYVPKGLLTVVREPLL